MGGVFLFFVFFLFSRRLVTFSGKGRGGGVGGESDAVSRLFALLT
jgi:hypothetical protein